MNGTGYREGANIWRFFAAITVDATGWTSGDVEISVTIPDDLEGFWTDINQTDGRDIRVLSASGLTKLTYDVVTAAGGTFNAAAITARNGKLRISGWTPPAAAMCRLVLAWGQASASSGSGSPTTASPITGYVSAAVPSTGWRAELERPGATSPRARLQKAASEVLRVGCDLSALMMRRLQPYARSANGTALTYASYEILENGSASGLSGMVDATSLRFIGADGVSFISQAGTAAHSYTISLTARTTDSQTLNPRCQLDVANVIEA